MTCARLVLLPFPYTTLFRSVMMLVQPTVLVTVVTLGVIGPWQPSTKLGALKLGAVGHSIVPSRSEERRVGRDGVSLSAMSGSRLVLLTHPSLVVEGRAMM